MYDGKSEISNPFARLCFFFFVCLLFIGSETDIFCNEIVTNAYKI